MNFSDTPKWFLAPRELVWKHGEGGSTRENFERITGKCYNCRTVIDRVYFGGQVFSLHAKGIVLVDGVEGHSIYRLTEAVKNG